MTPSLPDILAYQNDDVICRFLDKYNVTEQEALDLFAETKKFLYLSHFEPVFISDDMVMIDEMWHNFILFTKDYHHFCINYFGKFKHHQPTSKAEKEERKKKRKESNGEIHQDFLNKVEDLMNAAYDHLGAETVEKWFDEYAEKYSLNRVKMLIK